MQKEKMNSIKSSKNNLEASYGSSGLAENDTNYITQKNFHIKKISQKQSPNLESEEFLTFKKSSTLNSNNNITATFYKKSKNINEGMKDENEYLNEKRKNKVLNMIKNAHIEKIRNFVYLKEINFAFEEIQRYIKENDFASAKEMERELNSLQMDVIQHNIDLFSKSKLSKSHATFGQSYNNNFNSYNSSYKKINNYEEEENLNKNIQRNKNIKRERRINNRPKEYINLNRINYDRNINNFENGYNIPSNSKINSNNNIYNNIPNNIDNNNMFNYIQPNPEKDINNNFQKNINNIQQNMNEPNNIINNELNNENQNIIQDNNNINEQKDLNQQKQNKENINNEVAYNDNKLNIDNIEPNEQIENEYEQIENENEQIENENEQIENENEQIENENEQIENENEQIENENEQIENENEQIENEENYNLDNNKNEDENKENPKTNMNSDIIQNINQNDINNNINQENQTSKEPSPEFSSALSHYQNNNINMNEKENEKKIQEYNNNLKENNTYPQNYNINIKNNIPFNPDNSLPNNNYPNYNNINDFNNNNFPKAEKDINIPHYINDNRSKIPPLLNSKKSNKKELLKNQNLPKKKIKRPKSSKGPLLNINNNNIPDFTYPRKYYEQNNIKNYQSKSKSNSRNRNKSPKILFAEPSKGRCFACDVNCSISRSGNSPNKYVPYFGPLKKERKHITEYDGEKYGYYQYKPKYHEINNLELNKIL